MKSRGAPRSARLLFICQSVASARVLLRVAGAASQAGHTATLMFNGAHPSDLSTARGWTEEQQIQFVTSKDFVADAPLRSPLIENHPDPERQNQLRRAAHALLDPASWNLRRIVATNLAHAMECLRVLAPTAVIVAEDGISGPIEHLTVARHLGIPIIDVPYGFGLKADFDIDLDNKALAGTIRKADGAFGAIVRDYAPQWVKTGHHSGAIMLPPEYVVALESMGATVRDPWIVHGGSADLLCAENTVSYETYVAEGISKSKIALTGSPYCDYLIDGLRADPQARAKLLAREIIDPPTVRVLVSWPPSYHENRPGRSEFETYEEMTRTVLGRLAELKQCDLKISLHPAVDASTRRTVIEMGLNVSDEYVLELIPQHDLYVSYYSSTIRWAIASGKPVVNYDAYALDMDVYDQACGVVTVGSAENAINTVRRASSDELYYQSLADQQVRVAARWGALDGGATDRILGEIEDQQGRGVDEST